MSEDDGGNITDLNARRAAPPPATPSKFDIARAILCIPGEQTIIGCGNAGYFSLSSNCHWFLQKKLNWRTRFAARWLLGWKWTNL